jgi:hypothetical protein
MRRHFILLAILFALGVTGAQAQNVADPSTRVYFSVSSVKSPFALAGTFEGVYRIRDNSVEITVSSAAVYLRGYGSYQGRRELSFINVGLASINGSGKWAVISHARAIPIGETMMPGDKYLADKLRFSIPKEGSVDLTRCWLVVEMGELALDSSDEDRVGYAFAHSDRNIFSYLLAKAAQN